MKNATWLVLIFFLSFPPAMAQKLDSILSRSSFSFSYGLSHDYHSYDPIPSGTYIEMKGRGEAFGFEYLYRPAGKNEFGFGFSKQVSYKDQTVAVQTSFALINFEEYRIRGTKNFHYLLYKRHFIEDRLIGSAGIYNLRFRDPFIEVWGNSEQTEVMFRDVNISSEFGVFAGIEFYHTLRKNFQVGLRTRLFYTQGYDESFESFEFTPLLRFTFK
jgi:hypothetical protein